MLVLADLELTCWDRGVVPEGQRREVFQIGLCKLDLSTGRRYDRYTSLVKLVDSQISRYCTDLTGFTHTDVMKKGRPLPEVCRQIVNRGYKRFPWACFGDDRTPLELDCSLKKCDFPLGDICIDLGAIAQMQLAIPSMPHGQRRVMARHGLTCEGTEHDGGWDAWNLASLVPKLLRLPFDSVSE